MVYHGMVVPWYTTWYYHTQKTMVEHGICMVYHSMVYHVLLPCLKYHGMMVPWYTTWYYHTQKTMVEHGNFSWYTMLWYTMFYYHAQNTMVCLYHGKVVPWYTTYYVVLPYPENHCNLFMVYHGVTMWQYHMVPCGITTWSYHGIP